MLILNFKTYKKGAGTLNLLRLIERYNKKAIACLQPGDLCLVKETRLKVFSQHVDFEKKGRGTGFLTPSSLKASGVKGSLLNHSEHPVSLSTIKWTVRDCNRLKIKLIVCASSIRQVREIKKLRPFAIAFEDPKLISTGKSITKSEPKKILEFVKELSRTKIIPICGAGISKGEDYNEAIKLGCSGALVSSAVAKSKNPTKFLKGI